MSSASANGKICYIEIPATDVARSADFYTRVLAGRSGSGGMVRLRSTMGLGR